MGIVVLSVSAAAILLLIHLGIARLLRGRIGILRHWYCWGYLLVALLVFLLLLPMPDFPTQRGTIDLEARIGIVAFSLFIYIPSALAIGLARLRKEPIQPTEPTPGSRT